MIIHRGIGAACKRKIHVRVRLSILNKFERVTEGRCGRAGGTQWEAVDGDVRSAGSGGDVSAPTTVPPSTLRQACGSTVKPSAKSWFFHIIKFKSNHTVEVLKIYCVAGENAKICIMIFANLLKNDVKSLRNDVYDVLVRNRCRNAVEHASRQVDRIATHFASELIRFTVR